MAEASPRTETSDDTDENLMLEPGNAALAVASDSSDRSRDRNGDQKTMRRLAQNREAARKSRLRKKAYVQQLENSRLKLTQLEQELQRARQQGIFISSSADQSHSMSGNGALAFDTEYARWLEEHNRQVNELRAAVNAHAGDTELRSVVEKIMSHYDEIFKQKGNAAKADVFHVLSGMWKTPAERCFLWLGGFRPSELLKLLSTQLEPLTEQQLSGICNLQQSSQQAEDALSQGMEALQQSLAETLAGSIGSSGSGSTGNVANYMGQMAMAMGKLGNDSAVRTRLRRLSEPITLFGEREMERRDRLRALMVRLEADAQFDRLLRAQEDEQGAPDDDDTEQIQYPFFTEGTNQLLQARLDIAMYSLPRAKARVDRAKRHLADPDEDPEAEAGLVVKQAGDFVLECSEVGDDRPLTGCSFSGDASMLATSSWSGIIKVWSMPQITKIATLKGHRERATDVAFSPVDNCLATASADKTAKLWNSDGSLLMSFDGHLDRLARVAFHPSGKYLGTASFDKTWRLWDINTGTELLLQEGHSRSVYGVSFHPDGSLAASCGLDANARVWDLRSGRLYCTLIGHVKPVLGVSFSPNGHLVATASEDNFCRIWDLRTRQMLYSIPAHKSLISYVKFEPQEGYYLATSSYDTKAALWSTRDCKAIKSLAGHESKVTSLDISGDGQQIVTVSHDRTIKIWSCRGSARDNEMKLD